MPRRKDVFGVTTMNSYHIQSQMECGYDTEKFKVMVSDDLNYYLVLKVYDCVFSGVSLGSVFWKEDCQFVFILFL